MPQRGVAGASLGSGAQIGGGMKPAVPLALASCCRRPLRSMPPASTSVDSDGLGGFRLGGPRWAGGKSGRGPKPTGRWVAALLLPPHSKHTYCEPFAGCLGVLLQRKPAQLEIINDADRAIVNWWRTVRHQPDLLARSVATTPYARYEHQQSVRIAQEMADSFAGKELPEEGDLQWAAAWVNAVDNSIGGRPPGPKCVWQASYKRAKRPWLTLPDRIAPLAHRLGDVLLEQAEDGVDVLHRTADASDIMIYADPPYRESDDPYTVKVDQQRLDEALLAQHGAVAVSGYPQDRPALDAAGWLRHELDTTLATGGHLNAAKRPPRKECLWTNYEPPGLPPENLTLW